MKPSIELFALKIELAKSDNKRIKAIASEVGRIGEMSALLEVDNEELQDKERRAWEYARFFSGRSELLRLHIRTHLRLSHKDCIGWGEHDYRDALLAGEKP